MEAQPLTGLRTGSDHLMLLPDEILLQICWLLTDPQPMAQVSKRFRDLFSSTSLRAHWFLHAHGRAYALFYAMGRPQLFTRLLFQRLLELGAVLSLHLVQHLWNRRYCSDDQRDEAFISESWAQNISEDASDAVLEEGERLYSKELCCRMGEVRAYARWIAGSPKLGDHQLEDLFGKYISIPLPLFSHVGPMHLTLTTAVAKWPRAAAHFAHHGIIFDENQKRAILTKLLMCTVKDAGPGRTSAAIVADCELLINVEGKKHSFVIDEAFAAGIILNLRHVDRNDSGLIYSTDRDVRRAFEALTELYLKGYVPFDFPALVVKLATRVVNQVGHSDAMNVMFYLAHGGHQLTEGLAHFQWVAYYLLEQLPSVGLCVRAFDEEDELADPTARLLSLCRQFESVEDEIINVLMQPGLLNDTAILEFAKSQALVSDWSAFLSRIAKCLLLVPMKGGLLIAIKKWAATSLKLNFADFLGPEVERHALPWHRGKPLAGFDWWIECDSLPGQVDFRHFPARPMERVVSCCEEPRVWMFEDVGDPLGLQRYIDFGNEIDTSCLPAKFRQQQPERLQLPDTVDAALTSLVMQKQSRLPSHNRSTGVKGPGRLIERVADHWQGNHRAILAICGQNSMAGWIVNDHLSLRWSLAGNKFYATRCMATRFWPFGYDPRTHRPRYVVKNERRIRLPPPPLDLMRIEDMDLR